MDWKRRIHSTVGGFCGGDPVDVSSAEVVLRGGCVHSGAVPGLLQRLRNGSHRHEHGPQLRQSGALRGGGHERERERRGGGAGGLRAGEIGGVCCVHSDAGFQNGVLHAQFSEGHVRGAVDRHCVGVCGSSHELLPLLQGLRCGEPAWGVQGSLRAYLPEHGGAGGGGFLGAAAALPADLLRVVWVCGGGEHGEGPLAEEGWEVDALADGDGDTLSGWGVLRHRHVPGKFGGLCVAEGEG